MIGDRGGVHAHLFGFRDQIGNAVRPIQQAVMRVAMQMHKRTIGGHGTSKR